MVSNSTYKLVQIDGEKIHIEILPYDSLTPTQRSNFDMAPGGYLVSITGPKGGNIVVFTKLEGRYTCKAGSVDAALLPVIRRMIDEIVLPGRIR